MDAIDLITSEEEDEVETPRLSSRKRVRRMPPSSGRSLTSVGGEEEEDEDDDDDDDDEEYEEMEDYEDEEDEDEDYEECIQRTDDDDDYDDDIQCYHAFFNFDLGGPRSQAAAKTCSNDLVKRKCGHCAPCTKHDRGKCPVCGILDGPVCKRRIVVKDSRASERASTKAPTKKNSTKAPTKKNSAKAPTRKNKDPFEKLSEYEIMRQKNIQRNNAYLESLGLSHETTQRKRAQRSPKKKARAQYEDDEDYHP